ncbi:UNVERIFIED_CONTAM: Retrovirus-related Pol polyprotein from transposon RE1 [Sesamum radiatum]|uniref:Retrovirus-related Pol polyprotein from transposon RE1 n=1 Tax=Sesamum radiatum TaxID=300843 RepID=A0AAW2TI69_SESRA
MESHPGVRLDPESTKKFCKLKKSLYGLKQSPRAWFGRFSMAMKTFGYKQRDDTEEMKLLQEQLAAEFEMKNLRELKYFLGIEIVRYLKGSPGKGFFSKNSISNIEGYTNADWAGDQTTRKSTSGYFTFVEGNLVTWKSKKQKVVARSSAEAEFRGMAQGICELLWIKRVLSDLRIEHAKPMNLYCDNKEAIEIAQNPVQHDRTKHVEVDRHFIKEKLDHKVIKFSFVKSKIKWLIY